ncbi:carboxylesterase family protein [Actinoallomurus sp. NPDC050550]|uniref:carboxylesterase/lipase family protein n=1 Tax=Actinoallomurus sp. NPDC050550 TaxID=3154937 RepID=UPI0033CD9286
MMEPRCWSRRLLVMAVCGWLGPAGVFGARPAETATMPGDESLVQTGSGPVRGVLADGYRAFYAVPYAAPPVGELRWRPPIPPRPWAQVKDASRPAPRCPQTALAGRDPADPGSEDCLYLNVTTPRATGPHRPWPVMVWLHGGSFATGSGGAYRPQRLVTGGNVVVVTLNYRLGALGFWGYPGLGSSATFGLLDQRAALDWVHRNASAFGGDARNVTLFGQSAGALSICAHLTSAQSAGLFHRAILQSGACTTSTPPLGPGQVTATSIWTRRTDAEKSGTALAERLGCVDKATALACMRRIQPADLLKATKNATWGPAYDTPILPVSPDQALRAGHFHRMPVLEGHTRDEARLLAALTLPRPITTAEYTALVVRAFGTNAGKVAAQYPPGRYPSPSLAWAALLTDRIFACPTLTDERLFARAVPVFGYEFADPDAPRIYPFPDWMPPGAYHGSDLTYLFDPAEADRLTPEQRELAAAMTGYWTRFAATGDPNTSRSPRWPRISLDRPIRAQAFMPGKDGITPVDPDIEHHCGFWARMF